MPQEAVDAGPTLLLWPSPNPVEVLPPCEVAGTDADDADGDGCDDDIFSTAVSSSLKVASSSGGQKRRHRMR